MSDLAFAGFTEQVLSLSYEQTIVLMGKMLESLKSKRIAEDYNEIISYKNFKAYHGPQEKK